MAGTYPTSPQFTSVDFKINTPTQVTETVNGRRRRASFGTSYYSFTGKYATLLPAEAAIVTAFVAKQYGQSESFQIVLPKISYNTAADYAQAVGNVQVATAASVGAYSVALKNCGANKVILAQGNFFKFANHSKVYLCTDSVVSDGSGNATVYFSAKLTSAVTVNEGLTINAVPFTVTLDSPADEWSVGIGGMTTMEVAFREVW